MNYKMPIAVALLAGAGLVGSSSASVIGDTVTYNLTGDFSQTFATTVGPGPEVDFFGFEVNLSDTDMVVTYIANEIGVGNGVGQLNHEFDDMDWLPTPGSITSFGLVSEPTGWEALSFSFTADSLYLSLPGTAQSMMTMPAQDLVWTYSYTTQHDDPNNIPAPAGLALLAGGLLGFAGLRRKR